MWTPDQIREAQTRAAQCESVTLMRDSYLELLDTALGSNSHYTQALDDQLAEARQRGLEMETESLSLSRIVHHQRAALEQLKHGLAYMPYPKEYPELCACIDTLFGHLEQALREESKAPMCIVPGPLLFEFTSFDHWADTAQIQFRQAQHSSHDTICLDAKGRTCYCGKDFMQAQAEGAFPVRVFSLIR